MKKLFQKVLRLGTAFVLGISSLLMINIGTAFAVVNNCIWTDGSGDGNFSNASNWSGCGGLVPQTGDNLIFDNTGYTNSTPVNTLDPTNDLTGATFGSITFQGTGSVGMDIWQGNAFTLTGGITNSATGSGKQSNIEVGITFSGSQAITIAAGNSIGLYGGLAGSGNLTVTAGSGGYLYLAGSNASYSGILTMSSGTLYIATAHAMAGSGGTVINNGADIAFISPDCSGTTGTYEGNLTLTGSSSGNSPLVSIFSSSPKLLTAQATCGWGTASEVFGALYSKPTSFVLTGNITLGSDVSFASIGKTTTLTGHLSGSHKISILSGYPGELVVNSPSNSSSIANGTYSPGTYTTTLSDNQPTHSLLLQGPVEVTVNGIRGNTTVAGGAVLMGTGTIGGLTVNTGGSVAPGHSPGCLSTGNVTITGTYQAQLGGTTACSGYDQLKVTGTVNVTNATLSVSLYNKYAPKAGTTYEIINNDGTDKVTGTFSGLAEGATFKVSGYVLKITYKGGTGNDVVLTVVSVPASADTGYGLPRMSDPLVPVGVAAAVAGLMLGAAKFSRSRVR